MKIGVCTNMNATFPDGTGLERLGIYKAKGFDYVEIPLAQIMELEKGDFKNALGVLGSEAIECYACNNFFPSNIKLTGEYYDEKKIREYVRVAVEKAALLGAKVIVFGSVGAKNVPSHFSYNEAWNQIIHTLEFVGDIVGEFGIVVVIEHNNRMESNIVTTFSEVLRLQKDVSHQNILCLVDYFHFMVGNESLQALREGKGKIAHVHFARPLGRKFPIDEREDEYKEFFDMLKELGYCGGISVEAYSKNIENDSINSINLIKRLLKV